MSLSNKLIELRKEKGLTQTDIAEKLFVSRQAVSKWEKGTSIPDIENIIKLSEIFEVSTDFLLLQNDDSDNEIITSSKVIADASKKRKPKKYYIFLFAGISLILLIVLSSFFIPAQIKVYDEVKPSIINQYSELQNEIFKEVETVYHYEEITGNVIYFINTYYLHGLVIIALIFILYGYVGIKKLKKEIKYV